MRWFHLVAIKLAMLVRRRKAGAQLEDELRFHLDQLVEENIAAGMPPNDARMSALQQLGGAARFQEECRDMRHVNFIDDFLRDLAYTGRNLRRSPGFAALAILIMAIGIGANTAVFSIVDAVVLQPLTYRESERLFVIHEIAPKFRTLAPLFPVNALHFRV